MIDIIVTMAIGAALVATGYVYGWRYGKPKRSGAPGRRPHASDFVVDWDPRSESVTVRPKGPGERAEQ